MTLLTSTWLINIPNKSCSWQFTFSLFKKFFFLNSAMQPFVYYPSLLNNLLLTTWPAKFARIRQKSILRIFNNVLNWSDIFSNPWAPLGLGQLLYASLLIVQYHRSPYTCLQNVENSIQIYQISVELDLIHNINFILFFILFYIFSTSSASIVPKQQSVFLTCFMSFS